jgi:hypothetical protein
VYWIRNAPRPAARRPASLTACRTSPYAAHRSVNSARSSCMAVRQPRRSRSSDAGDQWRDDGGQQHLGDDHPAVRQGDPGADNDRPDQAAEQGMRGT